MKKLMYLAIIAIAELLFLVVAVDGQTLSPVIAEGGRGKLSGQFTVTNNGLTPAPVTVEARSFDVRGNHAVYRPLDATATVQLEEMSARLSPKSGHTFYFKVQCAALPCNVALLSTMTTGKTASGLQVRVILPFNVYLCDKAKDCRATVIAASK